MRFSSPLQKIAGVCQVAAHGRAPYALLSLAVWVGCGGAPEAPQKPPPPVRVETLTAQQVLRFDAYVGTVRSRTGTDLRAQATGHVTEIAVSAGQQVQRGEMLMRIDQTRQEASVSRARAASAAAESDLQRSRADLTALQASRDAARSRVVFARKQNARMRALFAADNVSREAFERSTSELDAAEANLASVTAQLDAQAAAIGSLQASVAASRSTVNEGRAELAYYNVAAPIDGRLGDIPVRVGDLVTPSTLLTTVEGHQSLEVYVQVPVGKRTELRPGLSLQVLSEEGEVLTEQPIAFVAPQVDPMTQTLLVKAPVEDAALLSPGQFVRVRVIWARPSGPTLPPAAVLRVNTQAFAFVVKEGDPPSVSQQAVSLGRLQGGRYLVEEGLEVGQKVVVAGIQRLGDGAPVTIEKAEASEPEAVPAAKTARAGKDD